MIDIPDHAWRYLASMCKRERERLAMIDAIGNMISLMAAFDSLNEIECAIPAEHWPDHESRDTSPVGEMTITVGLK